jgi:hypothetical protein
LPSALYLNGAPADFIHMIGVLPGHVLNKVKLLTR